MKKLLLSIAILVVGQSFGQKNVSSQARTSIPTSNITLKNKAVLDKAIGDPIFIFAWQKAVAEGLGLEFLARYAFGDNAQNMLQEWVSSLGAGGGTLPYLSFDEDQLTVANAGTSPFGPKSGFIFGGFRGDSLDNIIGYNYDTVTLNPPLVDTTYDTTSTNPLTIDTIIDTTFTRIDSTAIIDTVFFVRATSWFEPAAKASNWLILGPIYVPEEGAAVYWDFSFNNGFRDGYEVRVIENVTTDPTFEDFQGSDLIRKVTDATINHGDTNIFEMRTDSAGIPAQYRGSSVYVAFHHTANDKDVLYLSNFMGFSSAYQSTIVGIAENKDINAFNLYPNPTSGDVVLSYNSNSNNDMSVEVYDVTGKVVLTQSATNTIGINKVTLATGQLNNGIYGYKFMINGVPVNGSKFIVNK